MDDEMQQDIFNNVEKNDEVSVYTIELSIENEDTDSIEKIIYQEWLMESGVNIINLLDETDIPRQFQDLKIVGIRIVEEARYTIEYNLKLKKSDFFEGENTNVHK